MTGNGILQLVLYVVSLLALAWPLGAYMARVYEGRIPVFMAWLRPVERAVCRLASVRDDDAMPWTRYAIALLVFNLLGVLTVFALQRLQEILPLNPEGLAAPASDLAFNTAVSFATNTNWQAYAGESTMSYLTQMFGLGAQNFLSAASGMAVLVALARGFVRREATAIGNFWVDLLRSVLYILLPLSIALALALVGQGVVQTFDGHATIELVEPVGFEQARLGPDGQPIRDAQGQPVIERSVTREQTIAVGPVASQIAIKQLGTNGGGFFNANSAHPFENPTPLANFLEMLSILLIPAALCITFGMLVGDRRQGATLLSAMTLVFVALLAVCVWAEQSGNPLFDRLGVDTRASELQAGGNMEGKETRFGVVASAVWATATTAASNGSVSAMHDSFTPLGGLVPMWLMQLGEVIFGGVGSGLYGMIVFALVAVFVAGLMIGRTPEYLGKKIEAFEVKMAAVAILVPPLLVLVGTAVAVVTDAGRSGIANPGAHGFSEVLYAFSSAGNNNGSAFAGLSANTPFYNLLLGLAMLFARYWLIVPVLAIAGSLAAKKSVPTGAGTLPTHTPLFVLLLIGTVIVVGALTFLPALALGPIVEHLQMIGSH
ncbi:potassium-transporting ATPase subunit KdpA [Accumulibacter sp.]|uniref:potassium-transporting ATPase subunit KdpA n=1 Tax=Accumulibacter sp. TaxID=2053492 RepID=UPI0025DF6231|nr:potassium-transporting ATPase subunit KdpA [Accumulibacter sp.]MCM8595772.1 potassium-transporting ATPase subunit KdpA [Accumulibacter sp.]MCM8626494.1 potassium-transporting ATPase subunit KdpA [Accumulibacter sp.]MDS4049920.1 potassium-transporting ATPase subunit KdpA [Accumulibacter sp.]